MSMKALLEIIIHLESFRNIDIFFQGLYYVKVRLYQKVPVQQLATFATNQAKERKMTMTPKSRSTLAQSVD